jgi:hypothetical protein
MSDPSAYYGDFGVAEASAIRKRRFSSARNTTGAARAQLRGQRNLADIQKRYTEGFTPQVTGYNRRGLGGPNVRSGIRTAGLERYAESLQRDLGEETRGMQELAEDAVQREASEQADLEDYLAQLRLNKQQNIIGSALDIKSMSSY